MAKHPKKPRRGKRKALDLQLGVSREDDKVLLHLGAVGHLALTPEIAHNIGHQLIQEADYEDNERAD